MARRHRLDALLLAYSPFSTLDRGALDYGYRGNHNDHGMTIHLGCVVPDDLEIAFSGPS